MRTFHERFYLFNMKAINQCHTSVSNQLINNHIKVKSKCSKSFTIPSQEEHQVLAEVVASIVQLK
jgi:hypothetical protein